MTEPPTEPPVQATTWDGVHAMLTLSPDAVLVVRPDGSIAHVNAMAAELFRTTPEALRGEGIDALLPREVRTTQAGERAGFHRRPSVRTMGSGRELSALRADGTRFRVDVSLQPIEVEGARLVLAVVRDLTQRVKLREANQALAADAAALREFVSIASHELRTPLTSVRGFAETLLDDRVTSEELRRDLLRRIVRNADRQDALIAGLLDLARLQSGRIVVEFEDVDVRRVAAEAVEDVSGADVALQVPEGLVARADPLRLTQVLINLLTNAQRYGAPPIVLSAEADTAERVRITVADHGHGVPSAFVDALFEAFSQDTSDEEKDIRRHREGLGLGLYIASELVTAMAGTLTYRENRPTGARFVLDLPRAA